MTSTRVKAFMDDMFLMSPSIPATQVLLDPCVVVLIWASMSFRASKFSVDPTKYVNTKTLLAFTNLRNFHLCC